MITPEEEAEILYKDFHEILSKHFDDALREGLSVEFSKKICHEKMEESLMDQEIDHWFETSRCLDVI